MDKGIIEFFHYIVIFLILISWTVPKKFVKFVVFIPWIISLIWLVFDGCPMTTVIKDEYKYDFTYSKLTKFYPNIRYNVVLALEYFILMTVSLLCCLRLFT